MSSNGKKQAAVLDEEANSGSAFATDTRVFSDGRPSDSKAEDVGGKGEQFILASWASLAAGLWLVIAPWVLTFSANAPRARANDLVLGALIASMGATRVFGNYRSGRLNQIISGLTVLPGIWLIAAPFVLHYSSHPRPTYSDIITGVAVILFAAWAYMSSRNDEHDYRGKHRHKRH